MNVRISLVATANARTLTWGTAHDFVSAGRLAAAYASFGCCRNGRAQVVLSVTPDPDLHCGGAGLIDERIEGVETSRACPGCPDCTGGAR